MDFSNIEPSDITFRESLSSSKGAEVFLVDIRGKTCVMKVHHGYGRITPAPPDRETDVHICELIAYRRLQEHGICDRGIVPQFYGAIEQLDLSRYKPHLDRFLTDKDPPSAIFLEYIPDMEPIRPLNYTKKRGRALIRGIQEIHKALVYHYDTAPRNMMILKNDPERVVWLDFDRAQTFHEGNLTKRWRRFIEEEELLVSQFVEALEADRREGKINETYIYYCA
ncbi:hypothetical protein DTO271G3_1209 [Paecilomyces variotii]|nr:hypothetical protein DTO271G3_1209 [Paecilomyces variotii]